jgi:hypothetical protein
MDAAAVSTAQAAAFVVAARFTTRTRALRALQRW